MEKVMIITNVFCFRINITMISKEAVPKYLILSTCPRELDILACWAWLWTIECCHTHKIHTYFYLFLAKILSRQNARFQRGHWFVSTFSGKEFPAAPSAEFIKRSRSEVGCTPGQYRRVPQGMLSKKWRHDSKPRVRILRTSIILILYQTTSITPKYITVYNSLFKSRYNVPLLIAA